MVAGSNLIAPSKSANIESPTVPGFCQGFQLGIMHQSSSLHSAERLRLTALISPGGKSPFSLREWNAQAYRVMVVDDGFALNGKTYDSLSKVAFAITGTNWNGPRFFGLRDKISPEAGS